MINKLKVACLQIKARDYKNRDENKKNILKMIDEAAKDSSQLMVLPECAYPAYYISPLIVKNPLEFHQSNLELISEIKEKAKLYQCYIALGIVEVDITDNTLYNSALLFNSQGQEIGKFRKSFLWHFDSKWFSTDDQYPVFDTEFGKIGMFICADGRIPEIVRCLCLQGADILLDLTNWVTAGFNEESLSNPQVEYLIATRALENRVWIIAANKVGMEAHTILYCGKSAVFSPEGKIVRIASSHQEEIVTCEINLTDKADKVIDNQIDVIRDRKPLLYSELVRSTTALPIYSIMKEELGPQIQSPLTAVVQLKSEDDFDKYLQKIDFFIKNLLEQDANIIIFPESDFVFPEKSLEIIEKIEQITQNCKVICAITAVEKCESLYYKTTFLVESGKILGKYRKTHLEKDEKEIFSSGDLGLPIFKTSYGNIGVMIGFEGFFPEISRILTLKGADIVVWPTKFSNDKQINVCRTRSIENKIFVACSNSVTHKSSGHSLISSPAGGILTSCLGNIEQASLSSLCLQLSRNKFIVPYTNIILNRKPETYKILI